MPNYNQTLQTNNSSLEEIITQLNNMPDAGSGGIDTSDATATSGDILSGKTAYVDGEKVTGTIATVSQATPTITINSATGLITATATQSAGYVAAGTKSGTKQLAFQAAQTITPGTTNKTIAANTYLGGVQTIKGDANLVPSNIVSGKSIFGVVGTAAVGGGSGGGDTSAEDGIITRTISGTYTNSRVTSIGNHAFYVCYSLTSVSFPACTTIGSSVFYECTSLTSVSFPACTTIGRSAFYYCTSLTSVSFPACTTIDSGAFQYCTSLTTVSFPAATTIGAGAFSNCSRLTTVSFPAATIINQNAFRNCSRVTKIDLLASSVCKLSSSNAFSNTGIWSTKGSICVPTSLVTAYKSASHWSYFSNCIFGV